MTPKHPHHNYQANTVGSVMAVNLPTCHLNDTVKAVIDKLAAERWDSIEYVYVLDEHDGLLGYIDSREPLTSQDGVKISDFMQPVSDTLRPHNDQEKAVYLAVKRDVKTIPVIDGQGRFLGAVTDNAIIDIMHDEHLEDTILSAGIREEGSSIAKLATGRSMLIIKARAPWLIFGTFVGIGLGFISSIFEASLEQTVALAYFIPVVAYIADSVGTQSSAITVRALATIKFNYLSYLLRELQVGAALGLIVGSLGGIGAAIISQSLALGQVVALALFAASTFATVLATIIPIALRSTGKDPALGSGPLATAIQDVVSILVYFLLASWLII